VIERLIFRETTTIGLRHYAAARSVLEREIVEVETIHGKVRVKVSKLDGEVVAITSKHFFGYQLPAPPEVAEAVRRNFE